MEAGCRPSGSPLSSIRNLLRPPRRPCLTPSRAQSPPRGPRDASRWRQFLGTQRERPLSRMLSRTSHRAATALGGPAVQDSPPAPHTEPTGASGPTISCTPIRTAPTQHGESFSATFRHSPKSDVSPMRSKARFFSFKIKSGGHPCSRQHYFIIAKK